MAEDIVMTNAFIAMNGRDKWRTLVINGVIGTDEPWIGAMHDTLRAEAAEITALRKALKEIADGQFSSLYDAEDAREIARAAGRG